MLKYITISVIDPNAGNRNDFDFRFLNTTINKNNDTSPRADEMFDRSEGARFFSTLKIWK